MINLQGDNLLFLISQPRAGSTLTQRILGNHPDIYTVSEPWLMLHPLYALRTEGYQAEYWQSLAQMALNDFLQNLPDREEVYFEGLRQMYTYLYSKALASSGKRYFLDKTPRYYLIIPELYRTFPNAKFIILLRNPLAVLYSSIGCGTKEDWISLDGIKNDLIQAPTLLLEGIKLLGHRCLVLHYEQLLSHSESEMRKICDWLDIGFLPAMIEYRLDKSTQWRFGDQKTIYKTSKPDVNMIEKWVRGMEDTQSWRLANDYLQWLGQDRINQMGYSYEELRQILEDSRPPRFKLWTTLSLESLIKKREERQKWEYEYQSIRLIRSFQRRGVGGTIVRLTQKVRGILSNSQQVTQVGEN